MAFGRMLALLLLVGLAAPLAGQDAPPADEDEAPPIEAPVEPPAEAPGTEPAQAAVEDQPPPSEDANTDEQAAEPPADDTTADPDAPASQASKGSTPPPTKAQSKAQSKPLSPEDKARARARERQAKKTAPPDRSTLPPDPTAEDQAGEASPDQAQPERLQGKQAVRQVQTNVAAASEAFAEMLKDVLTQEIDVQDWERKDEIAYGSISKITGEYRKKRRKRIDSDRGFVQRIAHEFPYVPHEVPQAAADADLSREELAVLARVRRAHELTRNTTILRQMQDANSDFQKNIDWSRRDRAVKLRERIIVQEVTMTRLIDQAREIIDGAGGPELVKEMEAALDEISPESQEDSADQVMLTLLNDDVRAQVLTEVLAVLSAPNKPATEPPPETEIQEQLRPALFQLFDEAGLKELVAETLTLEEDVTAIDARLYGPAELSFESRRDLNMRRRDATRTLGRLTTKWHNTPPPPGHATTVLDLQEQLIERRLLDIGYRGALLSDRVSTVLADREKLDQGNGNFWLYLDRQQSLSKALDEARPDRGLLAGIPAPPTAGEIQAALAMRLKIKLATQKAAKAAGGLAGPGKGGKKGKKGGKGKKKKPR